MAMLTTISPHLNLRFDALIVKQLKWGDVGFRGAPLHVARQKSLFLSGPLDTLDLSWILMDSGPSKTITFSRDQLRK